MTPSNKLRESVDEISQRILEHYPVAVPDPRRIGREIELPVIDKWGKAGEAIVLWPGLLQLPGSKPAPENGASFLTGVQRPYGLVSVELGRGVVEIALNPVASLPELQADAELALAELRASAEQVGLRLLGLGMQPRSTGTLRQLTPKQGYLDFLGNVGPGLLRCTGSAADQVHVDVARHELVAALNAVNGLAGAVVAIAANSPLYAGRVSRRQVCREAYIDAVFDESDRWGSTPRRFTSLEDYVEYLVSFRVFDPYDETKSVWEQFVQHQRHVMPSGRAVFRFGTVEVRPACQQPFGSFWAPSAMGVGLVANALAADEWLADCGVPWAELMAYRERAVEEGLRAREPFEGFLSKVLLLAEEGLLKRKYGEERYLEDAWKRLDSRRSPADEVIDILKKEGMDGVIRARVL